MRTLFISLLCAVCSYASAQVFNFGTAINPQSVKIEVDSKGFIIGGKHVLPVMGEIHYTRVPRADWRRELLKMKAGGITIVSTYCFWIHHEAEEGHWDWSGNKDLHAFLETCKEVGMPVVLRVGPFCHGEVYQGGFPEWIVQKALKDPKNFKLRSEASGFIAAVQRLYSNIYAQASDMLWKNGGPVIGMQIENECRGPWSYYIRLKNMAVQIGFDLPFYTRTGWPKLSDKEQFGKMLPLYGDYADGFWDRELTDMPGEYPQAFIFKDKRISGVIATEALGSNQDTKMEEPSANKKCQSANADLQYPYLTCELGGGMMQSYHRRINMSGNEAFPLAICKVGAGSNLPGYYMYHGGSNWYNPQHSMAECQDSPVTNWNDMPNISYDFQSQLGEMGQPQMNAFNETRLFHQFLNDWGEELSQYPVDSLSDHYARRGCFVFRNNYVRILNENGVASVTPQGMKWNGLNITSTSMQPLAKADGKLYFIPVRGQKSFSATINGKKYSIKQDKPVIVKGKEIVLLSQAKANTAYVIDGKMHYSQHGGILYKDDDSIKEEYWDECPDVQVTTTLKQESGAPREVKMGQKGVAEQPSNNDFDNAAVYELTTKGSIEHPENYFVEISYDADCARVYVDGKLVEDNFWNGKPMLVRLSNIMGKKVELRILPLRKDAPIYMQKEQKAVLNAAKGNTLLQLNNIKVYDRKTYSE